MRIAILAFPGITALDAIGPYEVLARLPGAEVVFVAREPGAQATDPPATALVADHGFPDVDQAEVLLVPGGVGRLRAQADPETRAWVRRIHAGSTWTTSVCTGALILAHAGILTGLRATTHWRAHHELAPLGVHPVGERVVEAGKVITAAGVSAGIDMALVLAARLANDDVARAIQLGIEYDPQPPFAAGSVEKAGPGIVAIVEAVYAARGR